MIGAVFLKPWPVNTNHFNTITSLISKSIFKKQMEASKNFDRAVEIDPKLGREYENRRKQMKILNK